jgi:uncharacterized protein
MELPLRFRLRAIEEGARRHAVELSAAELGLPLEGGTEYLSPVAVDLEIVRSGEQLMARGEVRLRVRQGCVRCLQPVETDVRAEVSVVGRKPSAGESATDAADGMVYHDGESFDLGGEIRGVILLEVPANPLCRPDCAGLCPHCGADRNAGSCGCTETNAVDRRLAALEALRRPPSER